MLHAIDRARAAEGIGPLELPGRLRQPHHRPTAVCAGGHRKDEQGPAGLQRASRPSSTAWQRRAPPPTPTPSARPGLAGARTGPAAKPRPSSPTTTGCTTTGRAHPTWTAAAASSTGAGTTARTSWATTALARPWARRDDGQRGHVDDRDLLVEDGRGPRVHASNAELTSCWRLASG